MTCTWLCASESSQSVDLSSTSQSSLRQPSEAIVYSHSTLLGDGMAWHQTTACTWMRSVDPPSSHLVISFAEQWVQHTLAYSCMLPAVLASLTVDYDCPMTVLSLPWPYLHDQLVWSRPLVACLGGPVWVAIHVLQHQVAITLQWSARAPISQQTNVRSVTFRAAGLLRSCLCLAKKVGLLPPAQQGRCLASCRNSNILGQTWADTNGKHKWQSLRAAATHMAAYLCG
jgi:hypothetical protein